MSHNSRQAVNVAYRALTGTHTDHHHATTDTRTGPQDRLRAAYHLVLSGWEVREAAAWLGLRPERVRSMCPKASAPLKARSIREEVNRHG